MPIDIHAHFVPASVLQELQAHPHAFSEIALAERGTEGVCVQFPGEPWTRPVSSGLLDMAQRATWMQEQGVTHQCLAGWVDLFGYGLSPRQGADWCRLLNDQLAQAIGDEAWYVGVGTVPLQDATRAATELARVVTELGLPAVMIATQIAGTDLDDPRFDPFWDRAAELQVPVLLHPGYAGAEERLGAYGLVNAVGRASETTLAIARMIFGGVFERHPRLIVVLVHGGGFLPYQLGRLQRAYEIGTFERSPRRDPRNIVPQLYYDSVVFQPETLRFLVQQVGAQHVVLGSDYPFPIGDLTPLKVVYEAHLGPETTEAIFDRTAMALLGRTGRNWP